jgi:hypothetical protein
MPKELEGKKPGSGILEMPSIMSIAQFGIGAIGAISDYKLQQAQASMATSAAQTEFWTRYADQSAQNYRNYEVQLNSWYREADYVERRRQYESQLAEQQATYKGAISAAATQNFAKQLADLEGRFYEEEAKETIELENIRAQSISAAAKKVAGGQVGRSVIGLQNQYNQQYLANLSNRQITRNFRIADKLRAGEALNAARENTSNQVQFYTPQPVADPVKPMAPLPIQAVEPTAVSGPSASNLMVKIGNLGMESYLNYKSMQPPAPKSVPGQSQYSGTKPAAPAPTTTTTTEEPS